MGGEYMTKGDEYCVNFFTPLSNHAKANKSLIITLASIWFIGVFGFQVLLMALNNPTPEPVYKEFETVWPQVSTGTASKDANRTFARAALSVLGKNIAVKDQHKKDLRYVLSWTVYQLLPANEKRLLQREPDSRTVESAAKAIGLRAEGMDKILMDLLPTSLVTIDSMKFNNDIGKNIPDIMKLYLIHNRNALTDFSFLGFPFHYWYTAQFLLIMFVLLCLTYAVITDKNNIKHDFVEEN